MKKEQKIARYKAELNDGMRIINEENFANHGVSFVTSVIDRLTDVAYKLKFTLMAGK